MVAFFYQWLTVGKKSRVNVHYKAAGYKQQGSFR
jgi:hypothetical protein